MKSPLSFVTNVCLLLVISDTIRPHIQLPHLPNDQFLCWLNETASETYKTELLRLCFAQDLEAIQLDTSCERVLGDEKVAKTKKDYCNLAAMVSHFPEYYPKCGRLYDLPRCPHDSAGWTDTKEEQVEMFYNTADFGYIEQRRRELKAFCQPRTSSSSSLECTAYLRYCQGHNLMIDFRNIKTLKGSLQYRDDILRPGDIKGVDCDLGQKELLDQDAHRSHLMSWHNELSKFEVVDRAALECDLVIDKPVVVMKLDATSNMYHHFCDFLNLYLSQHMNRSSFELDVQIITWDGYGDMTNFASVWKVFTSAPLLTLADLAGHRVCFRKSIMFSLPPRMIFGLYYNMPLVPGCEASGLVRAFNRYMLTRLGLATSEEVVETLPGLRITFLTRSTKYRKIVNEQALVEKLREATAGVADVAAVSVVNFNHRTPFEEQLRLISATDLLIGIHGAGLTHTLFLPDWASVFELYNCEDRDCYYDLARLRGVHYTTWKNQSLLTVVEVKGDPATAGDRASPRGGAHAKFVNYGFESSEFVRIVLETLEIVRRRRANFIDEMNSNWWWSFFERSRGSRHTEL